MRYYALLEKEPTEDNSNATETKSFDYQESEPNTPYFKACKLFGKSRVIEVVSEEEL